MSEWFHVGQKVVCVHERPLPYWPQDAIDFIKIGRVYVVAGIHAPRSPTAKPTCFLSFDGSPWQFDCRGFRPLRARPTDISVFTQLLKSTPKEVEPA